MATKTHKKHRKSGCWGAAFLCLVAALLLVVPEVMAVSVPITFKVIPSSVPPGEAIYVTGNDPALGDWNTTAVPLQRQKDGSWTKTVTVPVGRVLEYKITRGGWDREAVGENHQIPGNATHKVTKADTITIKVASWSDDFTRGQQQITGTVEYHRGVEGDGILPRDVIVWLPPSYATARDRRYPVLYMHDGQNVFDPVTSFAGADWQVDEEATRLIADGTLQELIIVAAYNTPDRRAEYTQSPQGEAYLRWLVGTLKPFIDKTYRTDPSREATAIMGSSMGGLISFLAGWNYPDVFGAAACLSPAFSYVTNLTRDIAAYKGPAKPIRIYIDNGGVNLDAKLQPGCEAMVAALKKQGFREGENLEVFYDPKADHNERAWARRVYRPLLFLFRK
jgi:predicted alpha/beta superfamily hydrolase